MAAITYALAYLFAAQFRDGTRIEQTPEDRSEIEPDKRSRFFDVIQRQDDLEYFGITNGQHNYVVDLRDGHFEVDSVPISLHPFEACEGGARPVPFPDDVRYTVLYYRTVRHNFEAKSNGQVGKHTSTQVMYHIGWQTVVDGRHYHQVLTVT